LVNDLLRVVLLAEVHGGLLSVSSAEGLFGRKIVALFREKYPDIQIEGGYIGSGSRKKSRQREKIADKKVNHARGLFKYLSWVPWIRFAGVTGSVSHENACKEDDIDIFLVVQNNRLWLSRLAEQMVLRARGARLSFGDKDRRDRICINYYLSERDLDMRNQTDNFFTALEIVTMRAVFREDFLPEIYSRNKWMG
jgi:hypothetical protein